MDKQTYRLFMKRTANIYGGQKRRAQQDGATLDYSLAELRDWCLEALKHPCPYCKGTFTVKDMSVDHCTPVSRKGRHASHNLCFCCQECNQAKGPLTAEEYMQLLVVISGFELVAHNNVIRRLRAGGRVIRSR